MTNEELKLQRKELVKKERYSYDPAAFPGSRQWMRNKDCRVALEKFDADHPEIIAELKAVAEQKRAAEAAKPITSEEAERILSM